MLKRGDTWVVEIKRIEIVDNSKKKELPKKKPKPVVKKPKPEPIDKTDPNWETTDAGLKILREIGLLHTLKGAKTKDGERPSNLAEVHSLDLSRTRVTNVGLKELKDLAALTTLNLSDTATLEPEEVDYRRVALDGRWDNGHMLTIASRIRFGVRGEFPTGEGYPSGIQAPLKVALGPFPGISSQSPFTSQQ